MTAKAFTNSFIRFFIYLLLSVNEGSGPPSGHNWESDYQAPIMRAVSTHAGAMDLLTVLVFFVMGFISSYVLQPDESELIMAVWRVLY